MRAYGLAAAQPVMAFCKTSVTLVWVKVTDDRQCAMARAKILAVKRADLVERHGLTRSISSSMVGT